MQEEIQSAMKAEAPLEEIRHWELQLKWVVMVEMKHSGRPFLLGTLATEMPSDLSGIGAKARADSKLDSTVSSHLDRTAKAKAEQHLAQSGVQVGTTLSSAAAWL